MRPAFIAVVAAFGVTIALTPLVRAVSYRLGYLDVPGDASSHHRPVPKTGGYAMFIGVLAAVALAGGFGDRDVALITVAAVALTVLAAIDEVRSLPNVVRFVVQIIIAGALAFGADVLLQQVALPFGVGVPFGALSAVAAVIWIVGLLNAYNFMDGLNGLAAVEGIVTGLALAVLFAWVGDPSGMIVSAAIAGACAGFLPWNLPSGSIFMGDVGSTSLGFLFAVLTLRLSNEGVPIVVAALPLLPFLFDSSVTVVRRALRGEPFFSTRHRSHFYQRLNGTGYSHAQVTMLYGLMALIGSAAALTYTNLTEATKVLALTSVVGIHLALASWVTARENRGLR
jgi:UDP-N-acetylmuramyl pentapeptide phosphotransferase/UDP-N-acetylglucosamine-1-phosphate transferase